MAWTWLSDPVSIKPAILGSKQAVDISGSVPANTTAIFVVIVNDRAGASYRQVWHPDSTDAENPDFNTDYHRGKVVGVSSQTYDALIEDNGGAGDVLLYAYSDSASMETNKVSYAQGSTGWITSVDISGNAAADDTIAFFDIYSTGDLRGTARHPDSTDNRVSRADVHGAAFVQISCAIASQIVDLFLQTTDVDHYFLGSDNITVTGTQIVNAPDVSLGTAGTWQEDEDATAPTSATANGMCLQVYNNSSAAYGGTARTKDGSDTRVTDITIGDEKHTILPVKLDAGQLWDGYITNLLEDFYVMWYSEPAGGVEKGPINSAILIGALVTASRSWGVPVASSVLIGNLVTATRLLAANRSSTTLIGSLVSATKSWGVSVSSSVLIGVLVSSITPIKGFTRTATVLIGNLVSASRLAAFTRSTSVSTLYENYITGDDGQNAVRGTGWSGQTFTPSSTHTVTKVKLLIRRTGSPGLVTVSIRATASQVPTDGDLCSGTTEGNTLTTGAAGEWREITLGAGTTVTSGIKYAIVVRAPAGDPSNIIGWRADTSSPTYAGGSVVTSGTSGDSWGRVSSWDFMFEEWEATELSVGVLTTSSRVWTNTQSASVLIGVTVSALKGWGRAISSSVSVGVLVSASRVLAAVRSATVLIGNRVSASRVAGYVISSPVSIGVLVSASRAFAAIRSSAVSIGNLVSASTGRGYTRTASVSIGVLVSAVRVLGYTITSTVSIGVKVFATISTLIAGLVRKRYGTSPDVSWTTDVTTTGRYGTSPDDSYNDDVSTGGRYG